VTTKKLHRPEQLGFDFDAQPKSEPLAQPIVAEPNAPDPTQPSLKVLSGLLEKDDDGVWRISAIAFARWAGYARTLSFLRHVERWKSDLIEIAPLRQSSAMVPIGSGAHREVIDYRLTHDQLNHVLNRSRLARLRGFRVYVTKVFGRYQRGALKSTGPDTTIELQDAAETAERDAPGIAQIGSAFARREDVEAAQATADNAAARADQALRRLTETQVDVWRTNQEFDGRLRKLEGPRVSK
jgi:hypothetical protein